MVENLPHSILMFLRAMNRQDGATLKTVFSPDARVHDEDEDHVGPDAIVAWAAEKAFKYGVIIEPVELTGFADRRNLLCRVDGSFDKTGLPDPLLLDYRFVLDGDAIRELGIDFPE